MSGVQYSYNAAKRRPSLFCAGLQWVTSPCSSWLHLLLDILSDCVDQRIYISFYILHLINREGLIWCCGQEYPSSFRINFVWFIFMSLLHAFLDALPINSIRTCILWKCIKDAACRALMGFHESVCSNKVSWRRTYKRDAERCTDVNRAFVPWVIFGWNDHLHLFR